MTPPLTPAPSTQENPAPAVIRAVSFFDGQNLYRTAKTVFGYNHPNYDPKKLSELVCQAKGWHLDGVRFYTGVPSIRDDKRWHTFWSKKILEMKRKGINVFHTVLRYHWEELELYKGITVEFPNGDTLAYDEYLYDVRGHEVPEGTKLISKIGREKGIDVQIAIDLISLAYAKKYDAAIIFSQDQDLNGAIKEVLEIVKSQGRFIHLLSAFPSGPGTTFDRGVDRTAFFKIDKNAYDSCIDPRDYR